MFGVTSVDSAELLPGAVAPKRVGGARWAYPRGAPPTPDAGTHGVPRRASRTSPRRAPGYALPRRWCAIPSAHAPHVPVITDAGPSADDQLRSRRRRYTVLMAIHLVGLAVGGSLYDSAWGLGLAILIVTGPLQWVAVILANGAPRRRSRSPHGQAEFPVRPREEHPRRNARLDGLCGAGEGDDEADELGVCGVARSRRSKSDQSGG